MSAPEWSATTRGPGSGYMASGGDGNPHPTCAECGGLQPTPGAHVEFIAAAIGHRPKCSFYTLEGDQTRTRVLAARLIDAEVARQAAEVARQAEMDGFRGKPHAIMAELLEWVMSECAASDSEPVVVCAAEWLAENDS